MENSTSSKQEADGAQLVEELSRLIYFEVSERVAGCEAYRQELREIDPMTAFTSRSADNPTYRTRNVKFTGCLHVPAKTPPYAPGTSKGGAH